MKNILLLGGNGFLGGNIVWNMVKYIDLNVYVFDIMPPSVHIKNVSYFVGSIEDHDVICSIIKEHRIDVIVHMVSTIIPGSSLQEYINNCRTVQLATIPLIDFCAKNNVDFIYLSSGGTGYGVKGGVISEEEPTEPVSYYGLSKVQMEDLIKFYHRRYGLNYLIIRPSNPYGYGQNLYGKQGLIAVILGKILKNETLSIFGDGETIRDYIYIDDFVFYVIELIRNRIINDTINIGSGNGHSTNQIINIVSLITGKVVMVEHISKRKDDVPMIVLDVTKLHSYVSHSDLTIYEGVERFFTLLNSK